MLTIRLTRKGKKNQPFFRVVVIDKRRSSKGGRAVEVLGYIDPLTKRKNFKKERVQYWIKNGAQPSDTVHNLLVSEKIIEGKKINVSKISKKKQDEINRAKAAADASVIATQNEEKGKQSQPTAEAPATPATEAEKPSENLPVVEASAEETPAEQPKPEAPAQ